MLDIHIDYRDTRDLSREDILELYQASDWSSAEKPVQLHQALKHSHTLVTAWDGDRLVGLGNAISDGFLVVYYPHLLVLPEYRRRGIGTRVMRLMMERYTDFHQQALLADGNAVAFYEKCGFTQAGGTRPMWIYAGHDHD